jgi:lisH domain-containing protein FOPNL
LIINEMIWEYLEYNKYYNTLSVLTTESGQPKQPPFDRNYLHKKFALKSRGKGDMPLLYEIIFGLKPELATEDLPAREE